jgi:hypothetical protein
MSTAVLFAALSWQLQEPQHRGHHVAQLWQTRATSCFTRDHGSRDGPQLWLTGK